jgi:predicted phage terminase large subunit-like protein
MTPQQSAALAKKYLYAFPKFASNLKCPKHVKFVADKIQEKLEIKSNKFKLLMISEPPRHGKTLLISNHAVPWYLGNNPTKRVILTSYSSDLSDKNSDYAKNIFEKWGPVLWNAYPSKSLYNRDAWNTSKDGGCISAGIGGGIVGFGADLFIIDDYFKGNEEAESSLAREKLWAKWQAVVGTRLHPGCLVIILATRWNCLLPDNLVHCENGLKKIKNLDKNNDKVLTSSGYEKIINHSCKLYNGEIYKIKIYGYPRYLAVTANHRIFTNNGWRRADELIYENYILSPKNINKINTRHINKIINNKLFYKIKNIKKEKYIGPVFDITTPSNEFCSENMIVHNSDDLIGRLLNQAEVQGKERFPFDYEYINLPAIAEENDPLGRQPGEALWPERINKDLLEDIKNIVGPYNWESQYQGHPVKRGGNLFKSQNFRYYTIDRLTNNYLCWRLNEDEPISVKRNDLKIATIVDPAIEIKKKNDPCGMHTWGYSRKHKIWLLLDRFNDKIEHQKTNQIIKNFAFKTNASYILVENEKLGKVIVKQSQGNDKIGNRKIPFREVPTKGQDKYSRATPMASYCENERVFFPKDAHWLIAFEQNLKDFPTGGHDEDADLTAYAATLEDQISIAEVLASRY